MDRHLRVLPLMCALACGSAAPGAHASGYSVSFRKIADQFTPIPESEQTFYAFADPALDGSDVAFRGLGHFLAQPRRYGIYLYHGGTLEVVADWRTRVPGQYPLKFTSLTHSSVDGGAVAFLGETVVGNDRPEGVYMYVDGTLTCVADPYTAIPGGTGGFESFTIPSMDAGHVAFTAYGPSQQAGVYASLGGALDVVADRSSQFPGDPADIRSFGVPSLDGNAVVFFAAGPWTYPAMYVAVDGDFSSVVDSGTLIPGTDEPFVGLNNVPELEGNTVAFRGTGSSGHEGIYMSRNGVLEVVADVSTPVPEATGTFAGFDRFLSLDEGVVAFKAWNGSGTEGLYIKTGDSLLKVVDTHDRVDGRELIAVYLGRDSLSLPARGGVSGQGGPDLLDGTRLAFVPRFMDLNFGLYVAEIAVCGNGLVDLDEECDDEGESATCDADCTAADCGDRTLNRSSGEECDDGNNLDGDGCQHNCLLPLCGDAILDPGEECDQGAANSDNTPDACRVDCMLPACGDGVIDTDEECDDGNRSPGDECQHDCLLPRCGDGIVDLGEDCDQGTENSNGEPDACRADCTLGTCGDGVVDTGEECDDGNNLDGDGCSHECISSAPLSVPASSHWTLIVTVLLLLTGARTVFGRPSAVRARTTG